MIGRGEGGIRAKSKGREWFLKGLLVLLPILVTLFLLEGITRIIFNPVDYLQPALVADPVLGHKVRAKSAGHDDWGFRNRSVPDRVDIVAIGDSQTYGVSAKASESWPAILSKESERSVYNLSLGGYGPVEYEYLLKHKALTLKPSRIIVGLYLGNDILDAYNRATRSASTSNSVPSIDIDNSRLPTKKLGKLRNYLSRHSMLYRLTTLSMGERLRRAEMAMTMRDSSNLTVLKDKGGNVITGFTPDKRQLALDINREEVQKGLQLTKTVIDDIYKICETHSVDLLIVLIPTKESVCLNQLNTTVHPSPEEMHTLSKSEDYIRQQLLMFMTSANIAHIDLLPHFRKALQHQQLYPANFDGHPNEKGYSVIAGAIIKSLQK